MVAVDHSETAKLAFQEGLRLAKENHAQLHIVHVVDEFMLISGEILIDYPRYERAIRDYGQMLLSQLESQANKENINIKTYLLEITEYSARIPEQIINAAANVHADLIIVGTHGRRGFSRILLGSVAEGIIRIAESPVLLIRGNHEQKSR